MKRTVREWVEFLKNEDNAKFAVEDINGLKAKEYLSYADFMASMKGYEDWLDTVPVKTWYANRSYNGKNDTLFQVNVLKKD